MGNAGVLTTCLISIVPLILIAVVVALMFYLYRRHKNVYDDSFGRPNSAALSGDEQQARPLINSHLMPQLLEVIAGGRFSCVWKGQLNDEIVAVKVLPMGEQKSFNTECDFYRLPLIGNHDNILQFLGADTRSDGETCELWIMTQYQPNGSLYQYIKGNIVSWPDMLKIAEGIATGLAYLHEALPANKDSVGKPAVAHRDLKSKNILLKKDLTPCIGDFGLALQFETLGCAGDSHGQVRNVL